MDLARLARSGEGTFPPARRPCGVALSFTLSSPSSLAPYDPEAQRSRRASNSMAPKYVASLQERFTLLRGVFVLMLCLLSYRPSSRPVPLCAVFPSRRASIFFPSDENAGRARPQGGQQSAAARGKRKRVVANEDGASSGDERARGGKAAKVATSAGGPSTSKAGAASVQSAAGGSKIAVVPTLEEDRITRVRFFADGLSAGAELTQRPSSSPRLQSSCSSTSRPSPRLHSERTSCPTV